MREFPQPAISFDVRAGLWRLERAYFYQNEARFGIAIEEGFLFDLASIPRLAWWILAPFELSIAAPLVHDKLYQAGGVLEWVRVGGRTSVTRKEADLILLELMHREGVPAWKARPAYHAVRAFGGPAWGKRKAA